MEMEALHGAAADLRDTGWRRLPTAWIHFLIVELWHVYVSVFAWNKLVIGISTSVYMANKGVTDTTAAIRNFFWEKYVVGHAAARDVTLQDGSGGTLHFPDSRVNGFGIVWLSLSWLLPAAAAALVLYSVLYLASEKIWSFEQGAYLRFTWHLSRTPTYRFLVGIMVSAPFVLLIVWFIGAHMYPTSQKSLNNNFQSMEDHILTVLLLAMSLFQLAFVPQPVHYWEQERMALLKFRRSWLHLIFGHNASFGMKLSDALWTARYEMEEQGFLTERSRLHRYFGSSEAASAGLRICDDAQRAEVRRQRVG